MWLILGLILFGGSHLFSLLAPGQRDSLKLRLGEGPFKMGYSVLSVAGIVCLAKAYLQGRASGAEMLYQPWDSGRHVIMLLVLIGFILIFSNQSKGYIRQYLKQPFSIGVVIWASAHLLANGEPAVVGIFSMLLVIAIVDIVVSTARGKMAVFQPNIMHDVRSVAVGAVLYLVFLFGFHPYVLQVPVI